jgi:hypothetical protein
VYLISAKFCQFNILAPRIHFYKVNLPSGSIGFAGSLTLPEVTLDPSLQSGTQDCWASKVYKNRVLVPGQLFITTAKARCSESKI